MRSPPRFVARNPKGLADLVKLLDARVTQAHEGGMCVCEVRFSEIREICDVDLSRVSVALRAKGYFVSCSDGLMCLSWPLPMVNLDEDEEEKEAATE